MTPGELNLLWQRVEEARFQWKSAFLHTNEVQGDRLAGSIPSADGNCAHCTAIEVQREAVENWHRALQDFNAALTGLTRRSLANGQETLTPREREVLKLIAAGKSSKQIADELGIAFRTAVCHRYRLYRKLHVHTSVELTRAALRMGLVEL